MILDSKSFYNEYAEWTEIVAQYPVTSEAPYLVLGIADEWGELNTSVGINFLAEAGDVCWYLARYCIRVLGVSFEDAVFYSRSCSPVQFSVASYIGVIAGVEKKRIRDGSMWDKETLEKKNILAYGAVKHLLSTLAYLLTGRGFTLEEALAYNMNKLTKRLEAGTIKGDGDVR